MSVTTNESEYAEDKSGRAGSERTSGVWVRRFTALAPLWTLLVMIIIFSLASPTFLQPSNLNNLLVQISTYGILATGLTIVLITGQIDLSIAAVMALSAMVTTQLGVILKIPEPIPTVIALGVATLLGLINGVISTRYRIQTFMVTLAVALIAEGLTLWISQGHTYFDIPVIAKFLGSGWIGQPGKGIRILIVVSALTLLLGHLLLRYTRFGRYIFMTGASPSAARLAGVDTARIITVAMVICGFTAGLAGLANIGRLGSALPMVINSFLIDAIAVVVLGGTALTGGRGGIPQTVIGMLIYGTLRNGLDNMESIDPLMKGFITGLVLLIALIINVLFSGKQARDQV